MKRVIIIGGGFGGLEAAHQLRNAPCEVVLIDRLNHHLFQPLLYQVATASLSPGDIAEPIRKILHSQENCHVLMGTVSKIDTKQRLVILEDGTSYSFDSLILAPGTRHSYWGKDEWELEAPGLKTIQDALKIREKILSVFERAERAASAEEIQINLNFIVVGAGPTGVEMAGSIAEIALKTLVDNFTKIDTKKAKIFLIEGADQVLPGFPPSLAQKAQKALEKIGVTVLTKTFVTQITEEGAQAGTTFIPSHCIIWAAGNQASPILKSLNTPLDKQGRVLVESDLSIPNNPDIFVIGDAACFMNSEGRPLPGLAPVAKQMGAYVANIINKSIPQDKRKPFKYRDKGSLATIGRGKAVGLIGKLQLSGFFAWFAWSFIHVFYLIGFQNRILVMIKWCFLYITGRRNVQIISRPLEEIEKIQPVKRS